MNRDAKALREFSGERERALQRNRSAYDAMASAQQPLCRPAREEDLRNPLKTVDPLGWLGPSIEGRALLCLAAGGGRQSAIYAAAGARVTVVDLSPTMLALDRQVAAERGFAIRTIEASMDALPMLGDATFEIVVHPVSSCYLPSVAPIYREVARVLCPGGIYVSQHKQPVSLQASAQQHGGHYALLHPYYRTTPIPAPPVGSAAERLREADAVEYLHRWEQLIGGMCRAGFVIEDLVEPVHAKSDAAPDSFAARAQYVAPYVRIKARRREAAKPQLVLPDA